MMFSISREHSLDVTTSTASDTETRSSSPIGLNVGDPVEYSVSHLVQYDRGEQMWIKIGTTSKVMASEDGDMAMERIVNYVHDNADRVVTQAVNRARRLGT